LLEFSRRRSKEFFFAAGLPWVTSIIPPELSSLELSSLELGAGDFLSGAAAGFLSDRVDTLELLEELEDANLPPPPRMRLTG
jgi:hypothetical protein